MVGKGTCERKTLLHSFQPEKYTVLSDEMTKKERR